MGLSYSFHLLAYGLHHENTFKTVYLVSPAKLTGFEDVMESLGPVKSVFV